MIILNASVPLSSHFRFLILRFLPFFLMVAFCSPAWTDEWPPPPKGKKAKAAAELFQGARILEIEIEIPKEGIDKLAGYQWNFGMGSEPRPKAVAMVKEGGRAYPGVSIHLKGAAGSFRAVDDRPAMTLNFDKTDEEQRFHGLKKIHLNNSVQDPTYLNEKICRELYLKAGVPVPRAAHATVKLNGKDLGMYVLVEGYNRQFVKKYFNNTSGNLYDGGFVKDIDAEKLNTNSGDHPDDQSDLKDLLSASQEPDLSERWERLNEELDVDRFLTMLAMDTIACHWDGYARNRNNFRIYHDLDSDKMVFLPHGMDQMFQNPKNAIFVPFRGLVANRFIQIPEAKRLLFSRMQELHQTLFLSADLMGRIQSISNEILTVLHERYPEREEKYRNRIKKYGQKVQERIANVDEQLKGPEKLFVFDSNGAGKLTDWSSEKYFGRPVFTRDKQKGSTILQIGTEKGTSIGIWSTRVWLEAGDYQFQGQVRIDQVQPDPGDPRGGVILRADRGKIQSREMGNASWKELKYDFHVEEYFAEVELQCEFRAASGRFFIEESSLRLKRN